MHISPKQQQLETEPAFHLELVFTEVQVKSIQIWSSGLLLSTVKSSKQL